MTNTQIATRDGRTLTVTDDTDDVTIWLTDGRTDYIAIPSHHKAGEYNFTPASIHSRKSGGTFQKIGA